MFDSVAQYGARHGRRILIQEAEQSPAISLAGFTDPAADGLLDQIVGVIHQDFRDLEGVGCVALPNEEIGADNGGAALPRVLGTRELVHNIAGFVIQITADNVGRGHIDQVPSVDAIVAPDIKIGQLFSPALRRLSAARLLVHNAQPADPDLMDRALEQFLNFAGRQINVGFGQREDLPHAHAEEFVAFASEARLALAWIMGRWMSFQRFYKLCCAQVDGHSKSLRTPRVGRCRFRLSVPLPGYTLEDERCSQRTRKSANHSPSVTTTGLWSLNTSPLGSEIT